MYHRRYFIVLIAIFGLLLGPAHSQASAPAATSCVPSAATASITGTVRDANGQPMANIHVRLLAASSGREVTSIGSNGAGAYSLTNLAAGSYLLQFIPQAPTDYAGEWYNNQLSQASATPIVIAEGATLTGIDATLDLGAQITGRVTAGDTGNPLAGTLVRIYDNDQNIVVTTFTDASGALHRHRPAHRQLRYLLFAAAVSRRVLQRQARFCQRHAPDLDRAPGAHWGRCGASTRCADRRPRDRRRYRNRACPTLESRSHNSSQETISFSITDSAGYYTPTVGLASGTYQLRVKPFSSTSDYLAIEQTVSISAPNVLHDTNIALELGGQVTGRITDASLAPLQFADVSLSSETAQIVFQLACEDRRGRKLHHPRRAQRQLHSLLQPFLLYRGIL